MILVPPIAIFIYLREKKKERFEREYGTYHALDDKYLEYLHLCITNPKLDLYHKPVGEPIELSNKEKVQQYAMAETLISIMERAFLAYRDQSAKIRKAQWSGWKSHMQYWGKRKIFQRLWEEVGNDFDKDFTTYMNQIIAQEKSN